MLRDDGVNLLPGKSRVFVRLFLYSVLELGAGLIDHGLSRCFSNALIAWPFGNLVAIRSRFNPVAFSFTLVIPIDPPVVVLTFR